MSVIPKARRKGVGSGTPRDNNTWQCPLCTYKGASREHLDIHVKYNHARTTENGQTEERGLNELIADLEKTKKRDKLKLPDISSSRSYPGSLSSLQVDKSTGGLKGSRSEDSENGSDGRASVNHRRTITLVEDKGSTMGSSHYIQNAVLELHIGAKLIRAGCSNSKGRCGLKVPAGRYALDIAHPSYRPKRCALIIPPSEVTTNQELTVHLTPYGDFEDSMFGEHDTTGKLHNMVFVLVLSPLTSPESFTHVKEHLKFSCSQLFSLKMGFDIVVCMADDHDHVLFGNMKLANKKSLLEAQAWIEELQLRVMGRQPPSMLRALEKVYDYNTYWREEREGKPPSTKASASSHNTHCTGGMTRRSYAQPYEPKDSYAQKSLPLLGGERASRVDQIVLLFDLPPAPEERKEIALQMPLWCHGRAPRLKVIPFRANSQGWRYEDSQVRPDEHKLYKSSSQHKWYQDAAGFAAQLCRAANVTIWEELLTGGREEEARKERAAAEAEHQDLLHDAFKLDKTRSAAYRDLSVDRASTPEFRLERPDIQNMFSPRSEALRGITPMMETVGSLPNGFTGKTPVPPQSSKRSTPRSSKALSLHGDPETLSEEIEEVEEVDPEAPPNELEEADPEADLELPGEDDVENIGEEEENIAEAETESAAGYGDSLRIDDPEPDL